tara:strand:+ start:158 stop:724 length:567 start_codon:yes stop_codon:yes gene_type:complete
MRINAIIPAKGGSSRLPRKNIYPVLGRPMIAYAIESCHNSKHDIKVYVSTEDKEIAKISKELGAYIVDRPIELTKSNVYKQDVIAHAVQAIGGNCDLVISLQPNSPEVQSWMLDDAIIKLVEYKRDEIFSVDRGLMQNAAFRIMKQQYALQKTLSTNCGVYMCDITDIHDVNDVMRVESKMRRGLENG